ncbi:MAG: ATP-binding protein [Prevotella sp.]|nr:ATP-binding protein [Prevotella sp.]
MNNELILSNREQKIDQVLTQLATAVNRPLRNVTSYYSRVLERQLNIRQTLCLLNAQLAFFLTVFPAQCSAVVRILCACWLVASLLKCREEL